MDASKPAGTMNVAISPPAPHKKADEAPAESPKPSGQPEAKTIEPRLGLAPAHVVPKPVEVQSVPETPVVNAATPTNGTPRPELNLSVKGNEAEEAATRREDEGIIEPASSADEPIVDAPASQNGGGTTGDKAGKPEKAEMAGALPLQTGGREAIKPSVETAMGEKRKLGDEVRRGGKAVASTPSAAAAAPPARADNHDNDDDDDAKKESERAEKKAKNSDGPVKGKVGRPKKDRSAPPAKGRTERKTRSQGPAEI